MKTMKRIQLVTALLLFFSSCTSDTKTTSPSEAPSSAKSDAPSPATGINNLHSIKPVAGIPLVLYAKNNDKYELNKRDVDILTGRMKSIKDHPSGKTWTDQMEKATGSRFDRMSFGGSVDTIMALVEDVDDNGEISSVRTYVMFLTTRLSILYDNTSIRPDISERLLRRLGSVQPTHIENWKRVCDKVFKESKGKVFLAGLLISVDRFFEDDQYSTPRAEKYIQRLSQLSKEDVKKWLDSVDQYKGTELDAAMNIILMNEFFDNEKFGSSKYVAILNNQR